MRALIRRLSRENVLWSAETIQGHLLLLGFDPPCPDTIRKYMAKPKGGTDKSQSWLTFLRNHLPVSWAMDFFTVPTLRFQILSFAKISSAPKIALISLFPVANRLNTVREGNQECLRRVARSLAQHFNIYKDALIRPSFRRTLS